MFLKAEKPEERIRILMVQAEMITGALRMMVDIIEKVNGDRFKFYVAYKPEFNRWDRYEFDLIMKTEATLVPLSGKSIFNLRGYYDLLRILRKEKIDIMHCWDELGILARIVGKLSGVKIAQEFASTPPVLNRDMSPAIYFANKITSLLDDGFVACSYEVLRKYRKYRPVFFNNKVIAVVHNCVDVPNLDASNNHLSYLRGKYGIKDKGLVLTNIGHLNRQKAQTDLLYAFKDVAAVRPDVRLIIVGWGPLEHELKNKALRHRLQDKVIFTGKLNRSEVFEVLSITDLFVLASHWEGFGIVTAEAMALGKPVVATDTDGSREVIRDGETGFLVPISEPSAMAKAIMNLLENPELMNQMGKLGLERVKKLFNSKRYSQGYENFYERMIDQNVKPLR